MEQTVIDFISKVGFPMFVALYFMFKLEPLLKETNRALGGLAEYLKEKEV